MMLFKTQGIHCTVQAYMQSSSILPPPLRSQLRTLCIMQARHCLTRNMGPASDPSEVLGKQMVFSG